MTSAAAAILFYTSMLCHYNGRPAHTLESTKSLHDALPTPYTKCPFLYTMLLHPHFYPPYPIYSLTFATGAQAIVLGFVLHPPQRISPIRLDHSFPHIFQNQRNTSDSRRISLKRRPRHRKIRSMLRYLPFPLPRFQNRVFGRWFIYHIRHPGVPAWFDL